MKHTIHFPVLEPFGGWTPETVEKAINDSKNQSGKDGYFYLIEKWTKDENGEYYKFSEVIAEV